MIPVVKENVILKHSFAIPTAALIILAKEKIYILPLAVDKKIKVLSK